MSGHNGSLDNKSFVSSGFDRKGDKLNKWGTSVNCSFSEPSIVLCFENAG